MPINLDKLLTAIVPVLKRHPDAIVAIVMLAMGMTAAVANVSPYVSVGLPVAFYALYMIRMVQVERHRERAARLTIEKLEAVKGAPTRSRARMALERRKEGK